MNKEVDKYLEKQKSPQKEICKKLREIIFKIVPEVKEEMRWGVPTYADGKYYIVALKDHVNFGVSLNVLSEEKQKLLGGSGKTMKHIKIYSIEEIEDKGITELLKTALKEQ